MDMFDRNKHNQQQKPEELACYFHRWWMSKSFDWPRKGQKMFSIISNCVKYYIHLLEPNWGWVARQSRDPETSLPLARFTISSEGAYSLPQANWELQSLQEALCLPQGLPGEGLWKISLPDPQITSNGSFWWKRAVTVFWAPWFRSSLYP